MNDRASDLPFRSVLRNTLDSIREFRVVTTTSNADMGQLSGTQVLLVTKSGISDFTGSLHEFHRNIRIAANDLFNNRSAVPRAKLIRNVFGGSLGVVRPRPCLLLQSPRAARREPGELDPGGSVRRGKAGNRRVRRRESRGLQARPPDGRLDHLGPGASPAAIQ